MDDDLADAENGKPLGSGSLLFRPRILLAENEPGHQRLMLLVLRKVDADVTTVENGQSAVGLALQAQEEGNPFDLILMDIRMPVKDGYLATWHLREAGRPIVWASPSRNGLGERLQQEVSHFSADGFPSSHTLSP